MKINKKITLPLSILLAILFTYVFSVSPESILPEGVAFLLYVFIYLAPPSYLGYETCFMSGPNCVSNIPSFVNFIGPIILFIISTIIIYPLINFASRIVLGLVYKDFSDKVFTLKYYKKLLTLIVLVLILLCSFYIKR